MKFKVGDKVRVKSHSSLESVYDKANTALVRDMFEFAENILTVEDVMTEYYWIAPWFWPEECLESAFNINVNKDALGELLNG